MKMLTGTALGTAFLAFPTVVLALATQTVGNTPAVKQPDWAEGVVEVVNLKSRVYSYWVNGNENFFYRGNAQAVNEALQKFAAVKDPVRQLILLPGPAKMQTFGHKTVHFDWQLHVPSGIYKAVSRRSHPVLTVYISASRPRPLRDHKRIDQWLSDLDNDSFAVRQKARQELQKLGADAKPFLRKALRAQPSPEVRQRIEALLERFQDFDVTDLEIPRGLTVLVADELLARHMKGLKAADPTVCAMAIQDLTSLAAYSNQVVPALIPLLNQGRHEYVRRVAAACLAGIGAPAKAALPALKKGRDDPDANIRNALRTAIEQIEKAKAAPESAAAVKKQQSILKEIAELKKSAQGK